MSAPVLLQAMAQVFGVTANFEHDAKSSSFSLPKQHDCPMASALTSVPFCDILILGPSRVPPAVVPTAMVWRTLHSTRKMYNDQAPGQPLSKSKRRSMRREYNIAMCSPSQPLFYGPTTPYKNQHQVVAWTHGGDVYNLPIARDATLLERQRLNIYRTPERP